MASAKGHFKIVKFLVENGANIQARTKEGKTPLDLADIGAKNEDLWFYQKERFAKTIQFLKDKEAEK
jgi:ankyrin repeat protein